MNFSDTLTCLKANTSVKARRISWENKDKYIMLCFIFIVDPESKTLSIVYMDSDHADSFYRKYPPCVMAVDILADDWEIFE
jgi:Protein of unknown function (DUF2829)